MTELPAAPVLSEMALWVLPPFLGAVIGYVTNKLAIKMLFRPLEEKRILGIKIPLTPGIIPKQRYVLADSIARMVSERLITEETLRTQIEATKFQAGIRGNVASFTGKLLSMPLAAMQGRNGKAVFSFVDALLTGVLSRFLRSESARVFAGELLAPLVHNLYDSSVRDLIGKFDMHGAIAKALSHLAGQDGAKPALVSAIGDWVREHVAANTPLRDIFPEETIDVVVSSVQTFLPGLIQAVFAWLREDATRKDLEIRGRFLLKDVLDKLNYLQKFFITVGQYDKTLEEKMPEIVEEVLVAVEDGLDNPDTHRSVARRLEQRLRIWRRQGISDAASSARIDLALVVEDLVHRLTSYLGTERGLNRAARAISRFVDRRCDLPVGEILHESMGISEQDLTGLLADSVTRALSADTASGDVSGRVIALMSRFLQEYGHSTIADITGLDEETKDRLDDFLARKLTRLFAKRLPDVIASFNIKQLVVDKINQLDVKQVESLLMMVIARQLKWINIFGAILGALIGLSQVIIRAAGIA